MGSLQQPGRFLSYSNNIQRTSGLQSQGGYHQSLSGSETDVSTSNENLSNEERYVIRHTPRQEPQGQENLQQSVSNRSSLKESLPSNRSSLDVSSSSYNTLIIHSTGDDLWNNRLSGIRDQSETNTPTFLSYSVDSKVSSGGQKSLTKDRNSLNSIGVQEITEIPDDYLNQSHVLKHLAKEVKVPSSSGSTMRDSGVSENVELDRLSLTRKDNNFQSHFEYDLPNPIVWKNKSPGWSLINRHRGKNEKFSLSKSQPDLSRISGSSYDVQYRRGASAPRPRTKGREELDIGEIWQSNEIVDILIHENNALKLEIENCQQKVAKSQKLEQEISKVHQAHAELVAMSEKRERLERTARMRLQADCRRFQELNHALREQSDLLQAQLLAARASVTPNDLPTDALRKEVAKREVLIAQLITQNKELVASKERQEIELAAQRATLQEQRTHIDILDTALTNAQGNVVRLEEDCRKKQMYVERVAQLQRALSSLQLASDRREQTERKLRLQLERELRNERSKPDESGGGISNSLNETSAAELKRRLREREEKIMRLEGECAKWEQRYLEESALRQAAIDAASIPKDAKIAALEKTSQDAEKLIAEARTEKIRHMDEVHEAQKKVADLEARLKDFESKLAERDAMIRVLQKHAYDKEVSASSSFSNILGRSPHHTPHASLHSATATTDLDTVLGTSVSREELVNSVLTGSTGFGSSNSYAGSDSSYHTSYSKYGSAANKSFDSTKKSLDDQLKELDNQLDNHQLLNKRGLCCFPGFSNPSTATRKGKIPKPLLAGVSSAAAGQFGVLQGFRREPSPGDPRGSGRPEEEMLLLEKAGRSSQQQRCSAPESSGSATPRGSSGGSGSVTVTNNGQNGAGSGGGSSASARAGSLPPSSLPRPPRSVRRLVDYNRLDDSPSSSRKQADISSGESSKRTSPARSLIPPPRKVGEYNRLGGKSRADRDSASTASDNSASSLPPPSSSSKLRMYGTSTGVSSLTRRGSSLGRDAKTGQTTKYRIQF